MKCELCHRQAARECSSLCGRCSSAIEKIMPVSEWEAWRHRDIQVNNEQVNILLAYLENTEKGELAKVV